MTKIKIHGESKTFESEKVMESIVKINTLYYWRDSEAITKVDGRFFRKESPLIIKDYKGEYILRRTAIMLAPGVFASPEDSNVVQLIDGGWTSKDLCVQVEGQYYLETDSRIVRNFAVDIGLSGNLYVLKEKSVPLVSDFYGKNKHCYKAKGVVKVDDRGYAFKIDLIPYINEDGKFVKAHKTWITQTAVKSRTIIKVFRRFQNPNFPSPEHVVAIYAHVNNPTARIHEDILQFPVLKKDVNRIDKAMKFYKSLDIRDTVDAIRERINSFYDEAGEDENTAKTIDLNYQTYRGGHTVVDGHGKMEFSDKFNLTGGIQYTFGVEIETSAGLLSASQCEKLGVSIVADSSIGAGEYLTPPLHGDVGVKKLKAIMNALNKATFVDNRNAVHIHIGGMTDTTGKNRAPAPVFNSEFGIGAIKLGCQLQNELFASMPPYRQPYIKYCSGIEKFSAINHENYKKYLGAFVFGPEMDILDVEDIEDGKWEINSKRNVSTPLDRWCKGRYKWLNMVNAFAAGRFKTIEFRLFGATTRFDKVYNYLLTSLAFVWFVENRPNLIQKGNVTLDMLFDEAYDKDMATELKSFYAERKKRFADARAEVEQLNSNI